MWKLTTLLATAAALFFAIHPVRHVTPTETHPKAHAAPEVVQPKPIAPQDKVDKIIAKLRAAKSPSATCQALAELGTVGNDDALRVLADELAGNRKPDVRICAASALASRG